MHADDREVDRPAWNITGRVLRAYYDVYNELGSGFLESVYQAALALAFEQAGTRFIAQAQVPVGFRGQTIGVFRADFLVEDRVVVELKAAARIEEAHRAQVLNYLRATGLEVGLLLNFGRKPEFSRLVYSTAMGRDRVPGVKRRDPRPSA
jgi:GxxExxY protein